MTHIYTVLGTTDTITTCECCGREELKKTVALRDDSGEITYFGVTCAAKAAKWTTKAMNAAVKAADNAKAAEQQARQNAAREEADRAYYDWLAQKAGVTAEQVRADYREIAIALFGSCLKALGAYRAAAKPVR